MKSAFTCLALFLLVLVPWAGRANAEDIGGVIVATKTIYENSRLVDHVMCAATAIPCIDFGSSNIKLRLNGFTITGPADPDDPATCKANSGPPHEDGIRIMNQTHAQILGPGMVQKFRRHGIFISGEAGVGTKAVVRRVTSHFNCFSGILTSLMTESVIEENVSVRNAVNSGATPCGGNCLVNSHNNRIRRNHFAGNGSIAPAATPGYVGGNDFGVGLLFGSSGNVIEQNSIGGNINGVLIQATAVNNVIRYNVIAGNPPSQVSRSFGSAVGFDIRDESTVAGSGDRNTIKRNWCITYSGPGPAPCPDFPRRGHEDEDDDDDGDGS